MITGYPVPGRPHAPAPGGKHAAEGAAAGQPSNQCSIVYYSYCAMV